MDGSTTARVRNNVGVSPPLQEGQERGRREDEQQRAQVEREVGPEDVHLCGRTPDRRPWSRMEDEYLTRLVSCSELLSIVMLMSWRVNLSLTAQHVCTCTA